LEYFTVAEDGEGRVMDENVSTLRSYTAHIKVGSTKLILLYILRFRAPA